MLLVHESGIILDSMPSRLDLDAIERWLAAESYWAFGRPRSVIEQSIANSLVYGLYLPAAESPLSESSSSESSPSGASARPDAARSARPDAARPARPSGPAAAVEGGAYREQIGFFRVVTDKATFAWLCDVFIDAAYRGRGLALWALAHIRDEILAMGVYRILLATADAHTVYERLGFKPHAEPGRWMELTTRRIGEP